MANATRTGRLAGPVVAALALISALTTTTGVGAKTPNEKALAGTWLETVWFPAETGRPPLKSLSSYHRDGTSTCSDQGAVTTTEPAAVFSSCHGVWTHLENNKFAFTAYELISDLSGNLLGYLKVRGIYTLSPSGNQYTGSSRAEILDTNGNVLSAIDVANAGQRIQLELP